MEDPRANLFGYAYDGLNRLISLTDEENAVTTLDRDAAGDVVAHTDANLVETAYVRNGWGEAIRETSPDIGTVDYLRNKLGLATKKTDGRGIVMQRTFDDLGRPTSVTYPASTGENVSFGYDATAGGNEGVGRLTSVTDESGSSAFVYDSRDELVSATATIGSKSYAVGYDYDAAGRLAEIAYPSGRRVTYAYDTSGRHLCLQHAGRLSSLVSFHATPRPPRQ